MTTAIAVAAWAVTAVLVSELLGYLLHRLLHSAWIRFLSTNRMKHHLLLYCPLQKSRPSEEYLDATTGHVAIGNIGPEWIIPAGILLIVLVGLFRFLGIRGAYQILFLGIVLAWSFWVSGYLHGRMGLSRGLLLSIPNDMSVRHVKGFR